MLIISLDAVGDDEYERLSAMPVFASIAAQSAVCRGVQTVFVSNTYPIHTSVSTGVMPNSHGLISNTECFPAKHPVWNDRDGLVRAKTIWETAAEKGIESAAVFWPVTARSKAIRYNIPEVLAQPGKSQAFTSLKAGSKLLQLRMLMRHGNLLDGIGQPGRDNFAAACMADIIRTRKPGLALMHLTAYDSICHENGKGSEALDEAIESLDRNLGVLLDAAGGAGDVLVFTDHSQINVHTSVSPNEALVEMGLLLFEDGAYSLGAGGCFFECCGGSAFFHAGSLGPPVIGEVREAAAQSVGFRRFLTGGELSVSGYENAAFGICAKAGYVYESFASGHKAEHGYPPDMPDYNVFYMARGFGLDPGNKEGGSLLDIAPLVVNALK